MFMILSGLPGAGKSTITSYLNDRFGIDRISTVINHRTVETYAPGDQYFFLINDELKYRLAKHESHDFFVLERGVESTYAYVKAMEAVFGTLRYEDHRSWFEDVAPRLPQPSFAIHIVIDENLSISRRYPDGVVIDEQEWTNADFLRLMEKESRDFMNMFYEEDVVHFIDGSKDFDAVIAEVVSIVTRYYQLE